MYVVNSRIYKRRIKWFLTILKIIWFTWSRVLVDQNSNINSFTYFTETDIKMPGYLRTLLNSFQFLVKIIILWYFYPKSYNILQVLRRNILLTINTVCNRTVYRCIIDALNDLISSRHPVPQLCSFILALLLVSFLLVLLLFLYWTILPQ